ncbi:arginase [Phyllobacterium salinisoli]|uniref:Arginase n=1 Tax=Phyllobacterium salinisoli TaxID=1899321 RepID=A0A368JWW8_9HYPH|nr:arginase family protein [Phyllobacterium salinisoli]RCS21649.1 arginase [Phyllobacterium salinisoli]
MRLHLLHLDDALEQQPDFMHTCKEAGARDVLAKSEGRTVRLWGRPAELHDLAAKISGPPQGGGRDAAPLCFMGSGDFHHVTPLLLELALQNEARPATLIHFDNHPDWVRFKNGVHCGSWINRALENPLVEKAITVGVCSSDLRTPEWKGANLSLLDAGKLELYPYDHPPSRVKRHYEPGASHHSENGYIQWKTITAMGEGNFVAHLLSRIQTDTVYITIDKDVLASAYAITNWDQGQMQLPYLSLLIREIGARYRIVGADVTGDFSRPAYAGGIARVVAKHTEIMIDQPRRPPDAGEAARTNSAVNHQLLEVLTQVMA